MNTSIGKKSIDAVYILGTGSTWNNNEIRFSLRSIDNNLAHDKVFIVGHLPHFITNVSHIKADDIYDSPLKNTLHKLKIACKDKQISDNFILLNDDFFILKKIAEVKPYYKCTLKQSLKAHKSKHGYYYQAIKDTIDFTKGNKDWSLHYPFIFNKKKLLKTIELIEKQDKNLLLRTVYANMHNIKGTQKYDVKIRSVPEIWKLKNERAISTTAGIVHRKEFSDFIKQRFPIKSKYEI